MTIDTCTHCNSIVDGKYTRSDEPCPHCDEEGWAGPKLDSTGEIESDGDVGTGLTPDTGTLTGGTDVDWGTGTITT